MKRRDMAMVFLPGGDIYWLPRKALDRDPRSTNAAYFCLNSEGDRYYWPGGTLDKGYISRVDQDFADTEAAAVVEAAWDADVELAPEDE